MFAAPAPPRKAREPDQAARRYLLRWEAGVVDEAVADVFGFHAVQLGCPDWDALRSNRMPWRWRTTSQVGEPARVGKAPGSQVGLICDPTALPFAANSLDLLILPHTLELSDDPHAVLREAERVLMPEGRLIVTGINPTSLWGARLRLRRVAAPGSPLPQAQACIGYWRLRDWLRLLGFEVESARFGCYRPLVQSARWLHRWSWLDRWGERWWPIFGAAYAVLAVKRVRGMHLLEPAWSGRPRRAAAPATVAHRRGRRLVHRRSTR